MSTSPKETDTTNLRTVLIITYNHAPYIKQALDSVLAQKTNFNFKVYVCDDASTDGTSDIVRAYAAANPGKIIPMIREVNAGIFRNYIDGLEKVDTKYLALLDGDDYWCNEDKLQRQVDALEANADCVFCGHNTLENHINKPWKNKKNSVTVRQKPVEKLAFPKRFINSKILIPHTSSRVIKTAALDYDNVKNKGVLVNDYALFWWLLSKGKMYYIRETMSVYNITGGGNFTGRSKARRKKGYADMYMIINKELDYKYNKFFAGRLRRFLYASWLDYFWIKYFTPLERLEEGYRKLYFKFIKKMERRFKVKL